MKRDLIKILQLLKIELPEDSLAFERGKLKFYHNMYELKSDLMDLISGITEVLTTRRSTIPEAEFTEVYTRFSNDLLETLKVHDELRNRHKYLN